MKYFKIASTRLYYWFSSTYQPIGTKIVKCIDCGKEVEVDGVVKNKKRCDECQETANKERYIKYNEKRK